ncbi:MAG: GreA/GreB family elongation factor [Gaiellaceae bacterium]
MLPEVAGMVGSVDRLERRYKAELRRLQLLDELRGRLRAIDFECMADPAGERREALCAIICRHERPAGEYPSTHRELDRLPDTIGFGAPVTLRDLAGDEIISCQIACPVDSASRQTLCPPHSDSHLHRVCCTSPLGNALLGRHQGEIVEVRGGGRRTRYEILDVG